MRTESKKILMAALLIALPLLAGCGGSEEGSRGNSSSNRTYDELGIKDPYTFPGFTAKNALSPVKTEDLPGLYGKLASDLTRNKWNMCSERAHVWAYQTQFQKADTGKVFIFFTGYRVPGKKFPKRLTKTPAGKDWIWHTAPYVATTDGELHVLENFHDVKSPMLLSDWMSHQTGGAKCVELQGNELEIMKYTCGTLTAQGECTTSNPGMIEVEKEGGVPCYFRRVPSAYVYPRDVANHDYLGKPELEPSNAQSMYFTCLLVMGETRGSSRSARCMEIVNGNAVATEADDFQLVQPAYGMAIQRTE